MVIILDASYLGDKETAYPYLEKKLDLPYYFGRNLDALHDCLSEIPDLKVIVENADNAGAYYGRILTVLNDSCEVITGARHDTGTLAKVPEGEDDSSDGDN